MPARLDPGELNLPEELILYLRMSHPNVCRLLEAFVEPNGDAWLCMEYCRGGELFEQVAGTSRVPRESAVCDTEERVAGLVRQMAAAFRYIHGIGIVHRDNKLENWVFASPAQERIKLIDFGFATQVPVGPPRLKHVCGTCYYVAPEVLSIREGKLAEGNGYGAEVDIWALGVILYMLISGSAPFTAELEPDILWEIAAPGPAARLRLGPFSGRRWQNVSEQCRDLIIRCLERDPRKRLTAAEVQAHPWLLPTRSAPPPAASLRTVLTDLLAAGLRLAESRMLAYFCGHLALRKYIGPDLWSELKDVFFALEGANMHSPRGMLLLEELAVTCASTCNLDSVRGTTPVATDADETDVCRTDEELCRTLLSALDLTGDGRLHFYELFGALIAVGRVFVHDHEVEDAFRAFDVDLDETISSEDVAAVARGVSPPRDLHLLELGPVAVPVREAQSVIKCLRSAAPDDEPPVAAQLQRAMSDIPAARAAAAASATRRKSLWSNCGHTWKVARRFAFEGYAHGGMMHETITSPGQTLTRAGYSTPMLVRQLS